MNEISVIICTHNPNAGFFNRCLKAIAEAKGQELIKETIIIDNCSDPKIIPEDLIQNFGLESLKIRVVLEPTLGLTAARIKGISEVGTEYLIFIDDDNVIESNYLQEAYRIFKDYDYIGAFSGQLNLILEKPLEPNLRRYAGLLGYRKLTGDQWSNLPGSTDTMPYGAGLCIRREVGLYYKKLHIDGKRNILLDRRGKNDLISGGDNDLAACSCYCGMGLGVFKSLRLDHLIPKERSTISYLLRLNESIACSSVIFKYYHGIPLPRRSFKTLFANSLRMLFMNSSERKFFNTSLKGEDKGILMIKQKLL